MVSWSNMLRNPEPKLKLFRQLLSNNKVINGQKRWHQLNNLSHETFPIKPTSWQWQKTKDYFHFYFMLGVIPLTVITFCANVFIGPATLEPIPEGYEPKHWEYYRSPITRFFAKYCRAPPQQEYEKGMYALWRENTNRDIRHIHARVNDLIREREDYQYYYYIPETAKYVYQGKYITDMSKWGASTLGPKD